MTNVEFWTLLVDSTSTILAAIAILLYVIFWFRDKTASAYDIFDSTYLELLKTALDHPSFRNPDVTSNYRHEFSGNDCIQYEIYAFMVYNFCETIYDKGDKELMKTWEVIIETESILHAEWFRNPENRKKFKPSFCDYIMDLHTNPVSDQKTVLN